jgi:hypothetical protein
MLNLHRRPTDRRKILEALAEAKVSMTTLQLAEATGLELHRCARAVALMTEEHLLEHHLRRPDGWSWMLTDIGRAELGRAIANERGERYEGGADPDEAVLNANLRRQGITP